MPVFVGRSCNGCAKRAGNGRISVIYLVISCIVGLRNIVKRCTWGIPVVQEVKYGC
jgi:hypothetical protein